jgi:transposase-like protein/IS1 family transposase
MAILRISKSPARLGTSRRNRLPPCPNRICDLQGVRNHGNILRHSIVRLKRGMRRRYLCKACGKTFCSTTGTAYHRLQRPRRAFDAVVALRVEGMSIAAIARLERLSWNTVARWLTRAAAAATIFNSERTRDFELLELQADEMRTFAQGKDRPIWIYTTMEVSSRLWPTSNVGSRGYQTTLSVMRDVAARALPGAVTLIAADGYRYYKPAVRKVFGSFCHFGQVIKQRRKDRVVKVQRIAVIGTRCEMAAALERSEDSTTLNTSFIERLNLVIRQGSAYLTRRGSAHSRSVERLADHLELFRCFYNFIRPHGALRFGKEVRTPAQQAGLVGRKLTWRDILATPIRAFLCARMAPVIRMASRPTIRVRIAA